MATFPVNIMQLLAEAGDPAPVPGSGKAYTKLVAGVVQFFYETDLGTVYQLTPAATPPANTVYYVSSAGNDANDGLTPATAFLTLTKAESVLPVLVVADYQIVILTAGVFALPNFYERTYFGGQIYVHSVVDTTILGSTAAGVGTGINAISGMALVADTYNGQWIEMLSGVAVGDIRLIRNNTVTDIIPVSPFRVAPAVGDTFRVFEPSTTLTNAATSSVTGKTIPGTPGDVSGLIFERVIFSNSLQVGGLVLFYICTFLGALGNTNNASFVLTGNASGIAEAIHALPANAYRGAGITLKTSGVINNVSGGYVCALGVIARFFGVCSLISGNFPLGIILDGSAGLVVFNVAGAPIVARCTGPVLLLNGVLAFLATIDIAVAAGLGLKLSRGAQATLISPATVASAAGTAIQVESDALLLLDVLAALAVSGSVYGVLAQLGGKVRLTGVPNVAGGVADFAVGNVPTLATSGSFAAVGTALLPAVVLDGSVAQRVA